VTCSAPCKASNVLLQPNGQPWSLRGVCSAHIDITITLALPTTAAAASQTLTLTDSVMGARNPCICIAIKSWRQCGRGAAVVSFDWHEASLTVNFDEPLPSAYEPHPTDTPCARRVGGRLRCHPQGVQSARACIGIKSPFMLWDVEHETWKCRKAKNINEQYCLVLLTPTLTHPYPHVRLAYMHLYRCTAHAAHAAGWQCIGGVHQQR
jgi:hypothetical protein